MEEGRVRTRQEVLEGLEMGKLGRDQMDYG
jgi:hypothetical protein